MTPEGLLHAAAVNGSSADLCYATWTFSGGDDHAVVDLVLGSFVALLSGIFLALSMSVQRCALSYKEYKVPFLCCTLPRPAAWWVGFACYFFANLLFAYASTLTPLTLNATLFTLLLVWNLVFAHFLLHETLTRPRVIGAAVIVLGAGLSVLGSPSNARNVFGVDNIAVLATSARGVIYYVLLALSGLVASSVVVWFERTYSLTPEEEEERLIRSESLAASVLVRSVRGQSVAFSQAPSARWKSAKGLILRDLQMSHVSEEGSQWTQMCQPSAMVSDNRQSQLSMASGVPRVSEAAAGATGAVGAAGAVGASGTGASGTDAGAAPAKAPPSAPTTTTPPRPCRASHDEEAATAAPSPPPSPPGAPEKPPAPQRLTSMMSVVYPMSLGLLEGVTQLLVKALSSIGSECMDVGVPPCCYTSGLPWMLLLVFCFVGVLTVVWLKIVYTRFETTTGLPIEYGTVHCCSVLGGLYFYEEADYMLTGQFTLCFGGLAFVVMGVAISACKELPCCRRR